MHRRPTIQFEVSRGGLPLRCRFSRVPLHFGPLFGLFCFLVGSEGGGKKELQFLLISADVCEAQTLVVINGSMEQIDQKLMPFLEARELLI